jgi:transposase
MSNKVIIAADIAKEKLDIYCLENKEYFILKNESEGFQKLDQWIETHQFKRDNICIVFENTGSYGNKLIKYCTRNSITYYQLSALDIKLSKGIARGKDDKIDAKRIAQYYLEKQYKLQPSKPDSTSIERLKQLRESRDLLVKHAASIKQALKNDIEVLGLNNSDMVAMTKKETIQTMNNQIALLNKEIDGIIKSDKKLKTNFDLLCTIVGIGKVIALDTIMATCNFEKFNTWRQYASYTGCAPFSNESGKMVKKKSISPLARKDLKAHLTSGARSAVQFDQELKLYYERKLLEGKLNKCVINSVRAKLIARMFAVIRNQKDFKRNYSHNLANQIS